MKDMFLLYGGKQEFVVKGYMYASFQMDGDDSKSQFGWVFMFNGVTVTLKSSKHVRAVDSTCESEYIVASEGSEEAT